MVGAQGMVGARLGHGEGKQGWGKVGARLGHGLGTGHAWGKVGHDWSMVSLIMARIIHNLKNYVT